MPRKKQTFNKSDMKAAFQLLESLGKTIKGTRVHPDGSFELTLTDHIEEFASNDNAPATGFDEWKGRKDAHQT